MNLREEMKQLRASLKQAEHIQTELDRRVFHLKTLYDVGKDIFGSVEFETILRNFLLMTMGNFGVREGFILTLDRPSTGIVHFVSMGFPEGDHEALREGGRQLVLKEKAEELVVSGRDLAKLGILPAEVTCTLLFTVDSDHIGLLGLGSKLVGEPYSEDDKELLVTLVNNLVVALKHAISSDLSNFYQRAAALNVTLDARAHTGRIVAHSGRMRKVEKEIAILSKQQGPILISGGQGTGKVFIAAKIHDVGANPEGPFIVIDCRSLAEGEVREFLFGSLRFLEEDHSSSFESLRHYGAIHLANQGTLVLKHIDALPLPAQEDLVRYLKKLGDGFLTYPNARVIATTREDQKELSGECGLIPDLTAQLSTARINLPSLRDRRKDILPLSHHFLEETDGDKRPQISAGAEHVLVSRRYSHRNVAELREAIQMASLFANGQEILAEHIFTGPKEEGTPLEYDLGQIPFVKRLISDRILAGLRWAVFGAFSAIVLLSLTTAGIKIGQIANSLIWGLWWPVLIFVFLFVGRLWCTVCPIATAGRFACRIKSPGRPPSDWLKKYSGWLIPLGFLSIIWFEHTFSMTQYPPASGILLLSLMAGAVVFALVYQRETWCRYLCPLGNLSAIYSLHAPVSVRANPNVCATFCNTHECHKGSETQAACPVFHHPLYARDGYVCKLCFNCLKSCPHGSAKLYLRPPLLRIWRQADMGGSLSFFALIVFFMSPIMLASQNTTWFSSTTGFTLGTALVFGLAVFSRFFLPRLLSRVPDLDPAISTRVAFALLILAWGPVAAFHLANSAALTSLKLSAAAGSFWEALFPRGEIPLLLLLQLGVVMVSGILTAITFWGIRARFVSEQVPLSPGGWRMLQSLCALYLFGNLALILHGTVGV